MRDPLVRKPMPEGRPVEVDCYVERDAQYYDEIAKLEGTVIMYKPDLEVDLEVEEVAKYAEKTGLVSAKAVSVGILTRSRYAILLPHGLAAETFIKAVPREVWEEGFSFTQWSLLDDAVVDNPQYKVLIDLIGIPPDLYREREVIRAVSSFGMFLGTVPQSTPGDIAVWTVAVATSDLAKVPHRVTYRVGGLKRVVEVVPRNWIHSPLFNREEIPRPQPKIRPPQPEADEMVPLPRSVLRELCMGRAVDTLPAAMREVLRGDTRLASTPAGAVLETVEKPVGTPLVIRLLRRAAIKNPIGSAHAASNDKET